MNLRHPGPKEIYTDFFLDLQGFSGLLCPKTMLSGALVSTVSTQSESVDGQRCGQARFLKISVHFILKMVALFLYCYSNTLEMICQLHFSKTQNLHRSSQRKRSAKKVFFIFEKGLDFLALVWYSLCYKKSRR